MKLKIEDFTGYPETCSTVKAMKLHVSALPGQQFDPIEFMKTFYNVYDLGNQMFKYLNDEKKQEFIKYISMEIEKPQFVFGLIKSREEMLEKAKRFGSLEDAEKFNERVEKLERNYQEKLGAVERYKKEMILKYADFKDFEELVELKESLKNNYDMAQGTVLQVMNYFWGKCSNESYLTKNEVMRSVFYNLICVGSFDIDDFKKVSENFLMSYWGGNYEHFYSYAIRSNNSSAWKSFEKWFDREPFILKSKRMYEGIKFKYPCEKENKWKFFRCTGWNDKKEIKFVTEEEPTQRRFSFTKNEMKAFFKEVEKKIEWN